MRFVVVVVAAALLIVSVSGCAVPERTEPPTLERQLENLTQVASVRSHLVPEKLDVSATLTTTVDLEPVTDEDDIQQIVRIWRAWTGEWDTEHFDLVIRDLTTWPASERKPSTLHLFNPTVKVEAITEQWAALRGMSVVTARSDRYFVDGRPRYSLNVALVGEKTVAIAGDTEGAMRGALDLVPMAPRWTLTLTTLLGGPVTVLDASDCTATGPFADRLRLYWGGSRLCTWQL